MYPTASEKLGRSSGLVRHEAKRKYYMYKMTSDNHQILFYIPSTSSEV